MEFPFKFSCGHTRCVTPNRFFYQSDRKNNYCQECVTLKQRKQGISTILTEEKTEDYLKKIINTEFIEIVFCPEGCDVDLRFKPVNIEDDLWFPIQLKSSDSTATTTFKLEGLYNTKYKYQLLLCHNLQTNTLVCFKPFSEDIPKKCITYSEKSGRSKYLKFKLNNHKDLTRTLLYYYENPEYKDLLKSGNIFDDMIPILLV